MRILDAARRLDATTAPEAIEAVQVARFNAIWSRCLAEVPFYRAWARNMNCLRASREPTSCSIFRR